MPLFEWSDRYSVGVREMDAQHEKLVGLLNQLHQAMLDSAAKEVIEPVLASLTRYTATHFANEERLMRGAGYPDLARHKAEHDKLTEEVVKFQRQYQEGRIALTVPLLQFLKTWLKSHILDTDAQYGPYLNRKARG